MSEGGVVRAALECVDGEWCDDRKTGICHCSSLIGEALRACQEERDYYKSGAMAESDKSYKALEQSKRDRAGAEDNRVWCQQAIADMKIAQKERDELLRGEVDKVECFSRLMEQKDERFIGVVRERDKSRKELNEASRKHDASVKSEVSLTLSLHAALKRVEAEESRLGEAEKVIVAMRAAFEVGKESVRQFSGDTACVPIKCRPNSFDEVGNTMECRYCRGRNAWKEMCKALSLTPSSLRGKVLVGRDFEAKVWDRALAGTKQFIPDGTAEEFKTAVIKWLGDRAAALAPGADDSKKSCCVEYKFDGKHVKDCASAPGAPEKTRGEER